MPGFLASIPSPHHGTVDVGPLMIDLVYGLTLLVAIVACIWMTCMLLGVYAAATGIFVYRCALLGCRRRHRRRPPLPPRDELVRGAWTRNGRVVFEIWAWSASRRLGVGLPQGCIVGSYGRLSCGRRRPAAGWTYALRVSSSPRRSGRLGNWWNQELYGKALRSCRGPSRSTRRTTATAVYGPGSRTFHPTFLYEVLLVCLLSLLLCVSVIWYVARDPRPPGLFALYVDALLLSDDSGSRRFRIVDPAHHILGRRAEHLGLRSRLRRGPRLVLALPAERGAQPRPRRGPASPARLTGAPPAAWPCRRAASGPEARVATRGRPVHDLELDIDAFEGPFDLRLPLLLKEAIDPAEVDMAGIVVAFVGRLAERDAATWTPAAILVLSPRCSS